MGYHTLLPRLVDELEAQETVSAFDQPVEETETLDSSDEE